MGRVPDDLNELVAVEAEVDALRDCTEKIVAELERRLRARAAQVKETFASVKRITDVPKQLAAHPAVAISLASGVALALALGTYAAIARRRAARRPLARLRGRVHEARAQLAERLQPERPSLAKRLWTALLVAGASQLVRGLAKLLLDPPRQPPPPQLALPPRT